MTPGQGFAPTPPVPVSSPPGDAPTGSDYSPASELDALIAVPVSEIVEQVAAQQAAPPSAAVPPAAPAPAQPVVKKRRLSHSRVGQNSGSGSRKWLYFCGPVCLVLVVLLVMIATGRARLDRKKMESIGVPPDLAAQISGESPSEVETPEVSPETELAEQPPPASSPEQIPSNVTAPDGKDPAPQPQSSPSSVAANTAVSAIPTSPPTSLPSLAPASRPGESSFLPAKNPLPSKTDIDKKMAVVRDLYQQQYRNAKTGEAKLNVARQMISDGDEQAVSDPVGQFALWQVAQDIFNRESDFESSFEVADRMSDVFDGVDAVQLKSEAIRDVKVVAHRKSELMPAPLFRLPTNTWSKVNSEKQNRRAKRCIGSCVHDSLRLWLQNCKN